MASSGLKKSGSEGVSSENGGGAEDRFECFGWVYHLRVNKIGHEYCHLRFLYIRGKYVSMFKRDPHENPGTVSHIYIYIPSPLFPQKEFGGK